MAVLKIRKTGPAPHDVEITVEVADEHVAHALVGAIESTHRLSIPPTQEAIRRRERRRTIEGPKRLTEAQAASLRAKLPSVDQIKDFIVASPERVHSLRSLSEHFLGRRIRPEGVSHAEHLLFYRLQDRAREARRKIVREDKSGRFEVDEPRKFGEPWTYRWKHS